MSKLKITSATVKKLLISILVALVFLQTTTLSAFAQQASPGPWYSQSYSQWHAKVYDGSNPNEIFGERYTAAQVQWVIYGFIAAISNILTSNNFNSCFDTASTGNLGPCFQDISNFINQANTPPSPSSTGLNTQSVLAGIFADRPISGITYFKNLGRKFNIVPEVKAQTTGFGYQGALGSLPSIQEMWSVMRNFSYALFVFIILIFAFMIMFRVKISPQVVVSVQSALPKVAITLVLVTFSFAIAGFLIDLMYVVIGIISLLFSQVRVFGVSFGGITGIGINSSVKGFFDMLTQGPAFLGGGAGVIGFLLMYWVNFAIAFIIIAVVGFVAGLCGGGGAIGGSLLSVLTLVICFIAFIILAIIAIINFFKIMWLLAKTFLFIILFTVFAPIWLTLGAILPGFGVGAWIKSYASKLAVFPGVGLMFVLSLWLMQMAWEAVRNMQCSWGALGPALGTGNVASTDFPAGWPPLMGGSPQAVALLLLIASMGAFVMIPKVADMIEGFVAGKGFNLGTAIGGDLTTLGLGATNYLSSSQQAAYQAETRAAAAAGRPVDVNAQRIQDIYSFFRGISGGRIK